MVCWTRLGSGCQGLWEEVKLNCESLYHNILVDFKTALGAIAIAILFFFAIIFAWSTGAAEVSGTLRATRLIIAAMLFIAGFGIAYYITKKPKTIVQKLEVSGEMKAVPLKCPNCSGSVDANSIKIVDGVPYATCSYCGHTFEVTEEPKW